MGTRRIRRPVGVVVLGAVGLAGCAAAPTPAPSGASRTSLASTPSGVESSTGIPSPSSTITDAQAALQAEAVEAVKKFYDAWNAAIVSRDSRAMRALVLPQCVLCMSDIGNIDDLKKQNQTVRGGQVTLGKLTASKGSDRAIAVRGEVVRGPVEIFGADGKLVRSFAVDRVPNMLWILERSEGVLKIRDQVR